MKKGIALSFIILSLTACSQEIRTVVEPVPSSLPLQLSEFPIICAPSGTVAQLEETKAITTISLLCKDSYDFSVDKMIFDDNNFVSSYKISPDGIQWTNSKSENGILTFKTDPILDPEYGDIQEIRLKNLEFQGKTLFQEDQDLGSVDELSKEGNFELNEKGTGGTLNLKGTSVFISFSENSATTP